MYLNQRFFLFSLSFFLIVISVSLFPVFAFATAPIGGAHINDTVITGWACDPDSPDTALKVYVSQHGPVGSLYAKNLGSVTANKPREAAVQTACKSSVNTHGFSMNITPYESTDLFYFYGQDVGTNGVGVGKNLNLPISPISSMLFTPVYYRSVTYEGATDRLSNKAGWSNLLVSDGVNMYAVILKGTFEDPTSHLTSAEGIVEIRRKKINTEEAFATIWSKNMKDWPGLLIDKYGALHVLYIEPDFTDSSHRGRVRYEKSANPKTKTPIFTTEQAPDIGQLCTTCRHTWMYDMANDTIHFTIDTPARRWYLSKKITDGQWQPKELLYLADKTIFFEGTEVYQYFYYPQMIIFQDAVHIFTTANIFSPTDSKLRGFNGIRHFWRPLSGSASSWHNEWIDGPYQELDFTSFADSVAVTRQNTLILLSHFSAGNGKMERKTRIYESETGFGPWVKTDILPNESNIGCLQKTSEGNLHLFTTTPSSFLYYASSNNGTDWNWYQIKNPGGIQRTAYAVGCLNTNNMSTARPAVTVSTLKTSQRADKESAAGLLTPDGHTVIYVDITPTVLPLPKLTVTKSVSASKIVGQGINCGDDCTEQYPSGTSVVLTALPAANSPLLGWSGSCTGSSSKCTLTLDMNRNVTANFKNSQSALSDSISALSFYSSQKQLDEFFSVFWNFISTLYYHIHQSLNFAIFDLGFGISPHYPGSVCNASLQVRVLAGRLAAKLCSIILRSVV